MATQAQRDDLRYDLDVTESVMDNVEVDRLFERAALSYPANTLASDAYAGLLAIRKLMTSASRLVDYTQANSSERLSQIFDHLKALRLVYLEELERAVVNADGAVRFAGVRRKPVRLEEFPDDFPVFTVNDNDVSRP